MPIYHAPLNDMKFLLEEVFQAERQLKQFATFSDIDQELMFDILTEAAKFCENELLPLNQKGDEIGCKLVNGEVTTPPGFKSAYAKMVAAGWLSLYADKKYGGQGLPKIVQVFFDEILASCNVSFSLYTVLTQGAYHALHLHGTEAMKKTYLPKLISGEWAGTMCLTEPHCGTDLGLLKTKAIPNDDGSYAISGTKIFITSGEHDLTDNIIQTVLARMPDAPAGVKGISMFLVPKFLVNEDGSLAERNNFTCGSLEHKMGIKGSSTCVMNFDGAKGFLIGKPHEGLKAMFSMMNLERLNIGLEGLSLAEIAYQNAVAYAKERLQSRSLTGAKYPEKTADPIIVHPDVRRMLLNIRAFTEGARAMAAWLALLVDQAEYAENKDNVEIANELIALLTPVVKAYFTDKGFDACNLALQVLGGHGYIKEWGMEQYVRDARIAQIYEGTNGIQALDLVKRKLVFNEGKALNYLTEIISEFITEHKNEEKLTDIIHALEAGLRDFVSVSFHIIKIAEENPSDIGAAASDYLHYLGLIVMGYLWAKMASTASAKTEQDFYKTKCQTAEFFFARIFPQVESLKAIITQGSQTLMQVADEAF
ncbi:MAG: acyl-CoA dehydrogenase C-terminal domain-containing protein [Pseudomonadota bacterium]